MARYLVIGTEGQPPSVLGFDVKIEKSLLTCGALTCILEDGLPAGEHTARIYGKQGLVRQVRVATSLIEEGLWQNKVFTVKEARA